MKEMVYTETFHKHELLDYGWYKGRRYWVSSLGYHPCCYIEILKRDLWYKVNYDDAHLYVHGGPTYSDSSLPWDEQERNQWFIGWDYGHYGDYTVTLAEAALGNELPLHKWTTQEMHDECIKALDQVDACGNIWE